MTVDTNIGQFLCDGIRDMHDPHRRRKFLSEVWDSQSTVDQWSQRQFRTSTGEPVFNSASLPQFLHGGDSEKKIVIVGINPGWSQDIDAWQVTNIFNGKTYAEYHDDFYRQFRLYLAQAKRPYSPYWRKLPRVVESLFGEVLPRRAQETGDEYVERLCVAQDLLPFPSYRDNLNAKRIAANAELHALCQATLSGVLQSKAACMALLSPVGYIFADQAIRDYKGDVAFRGPILGQTTSGRSLEVLALVGKIGTIVVVAVSNQLSVQPRFGMEYFSQQLRPRIRAMWP